MDDSADDRFRIDERFEEENEEDNDYEQRPVKSFQRFDPENPDHVSWMERNKSNVINRKKSKPLDAETFNDEIDIFEKKIIKGQFHEMDQSFAHELQRSLAGKSKGKDKKFSFLAMVGRKDDPDEESDEIKEEEPEVATTSTKKKSKKKEVVEPSAQTFEKPCFFIDTSEKQFCDVLNSFTCQQNMDLVRKKWKVEREKIITRYKDIHKKAVRTKEWEDKPQNLKRKRNAGN